MLQQISETVGKLLFTNLKVVENKYVKRFFKLTWIIAVALLFGGLVFYSNQAYRKWHSAPDISISVKQTPSRDIPFPAITLCQPTLPAQLGLDIDPREYLENLNRGFATPSLSVEQQNFMSLAVQTCYPHLASGAMEHVCPNRSETSVGRLRTKLQSAFRFRKCFFGNVIYPCVKLLTLVLTDYGFCTSFNIQGYKALFNEGLLSDDFDFYKIYNKISEKHYTDTLNTTVERHKMWTLEKGFGVTFDDTVPVRAIKMNSYSFELTLTRMALFCDTMGRVFKLIVHMPNEIPTPFHESHYVEIGNKKYFKVSAKVDKLSENMRGYPPQIRRCYYEGERRLRFFRSYTKALCEFECMTNYTLQHCGCVKFTMPRTNDTKVCDLDRVECYHRIATSWPSVGDEEGAASKCNCLSPCTNIEYALKVDMETVNNLLFGAKEYAFRKYTTFIELVFAGHVVEEHTSYVTYTIQNLVADVGGLIGLFLGFSLLSIFEICCSFFGVCLKFACKNGGMNSALARNFYKLSWTAAVALLLSGFFFYSSGVFRKWQIEPDISVTVKQVPSSDIPMPAITVCHPFFAREYAYIIKNVTQILRDLKQGIRVNLTVEEQNYLAAITQTCYTDDLVKICEKTLTNRSEKNVTKLLSNTSDTFRYTECAFKGVESVCGYILDPSLTEHGLCGTFNLHGHRSILREGLSEELSWLRTRRGMSRYPYFESPLFTVLLDDSERSNWTLHGGYETDDEEVLPVRAMPANTFHLDIEHDHGSIYCTLIGRGFRVYFHMPNELITPFHEYQFVELQHHKSFAVSAIKHTTSDGMRGYRPEVRGCYYEGERRLQFFKSYTKALCEYECMINYTLQQCGCVKFSMPRLNDTKVCDIVDVGCYHKIIHLWPTFGLNSTDVSEACQCLQPCTSIEYIVEEEKGGVFHSVGLYTNVVVTFASHQINEHARYIAYTLQNWISDTGGLIGLFLGLSLLSIFELICDAAVACLKLRRKRGKISDQSSEESEAEAKANKSPQAKATLTLVWVTAVMLSFFGLAFYIYQAYSKWHISPDITIAIRDVSSREIPLPAVTICSTLLPHEMRKDPLIILNMVLTNNFQPNFTVLEQNHIAVIMHTCSPVHYPIGARRVCRNRSETDIVKLLKEGTYNTRYRSCTFKTSEFSCDTMLQKTLTDLGICYTINIQRYERIFSEGALSGDFVMFKPPSAATNLSNGHLLDAAEAQWTLDKGYKADRDEVFPFRATKQNVIALESFVATNESYFYCSALGVGYKLIFHLPNEAPTPFHKTHFVDLYRMKVLNINAKVSKISRAMHEYPSKVRRCYLEGERKLKFFKSYTKTLCDYECMTNYTLQLCDCVKFSMPRDQVTKVCDLDKIECYLSASESWAKEAAATCNCLQSCTDIEYDIGLERDYHYDRYDEIGTGLTKLMYAFAKHTAVEHTSYVAYSVQNFIADSGGLLGLFLGFSLLSIFELLCNLIALCLKMSRGRVDSNVTLVEAK